MTRDKAIWNALVEQHEATGDGVTLFLRSLAASGYAVVPVEATETMVAAVEHSARMGGIWTATSAWSAMLAAAQEDSRE